MHAEKILVLYLCSAVSTTLDKVVLREARNWNSLMTKKKSLASGSCFEKISDS